SYQSPGLRTARCGSPARSGFPVAVRAPARAQQFEPDEPPAPGTISRRAARPASTELVERSGATRAQACSSTALADTPDGSGMSVSRAALPGRNELVPGRISCAALPEASDVRSVPTTVA